MYDWIELGNRLRILRLERGYSQARLSEAAGFSVTLLRAFEHGKRPMTVEHLVVLARVLGVSTDYLACGRQEAAAYLAPGLWRLRGGSSCAWWRRRALRLARPKRLSSQCPKGLKHDD